MKLHHPFKMKIIIIAVIFLFTASIALSASAATYSYDKLNRLISVEYINGQKITYTYDPGGNLTSVSYSEVPQFLAVKSSIPANNAAGVPVEQDITVTFNVYIQPGSAYDSISVKDAAYNPVDFAKAIANDTLTINPTTNLNYNTKYTVTIPAHSVTDTNFHDLPADYSFSFTTGDVPDTIAPTVISTNPADGATGMAINTNINITFSKAVVESVYFGDITISDGSSVLSYTYSLADTTLILDPASDLSYNTTYTVNIPAGSLQDAAGNILASDYNFSFTTGDVPDTLSVNHLAVGVEIKKCCADVAYLTA